MTDRIYEIEQIIQIVMGYSDEIEVTPQTYHQNGAVGPTEGLQHVSLYWAPDCPNAV